MEGGKKDHRKEVVITDVEGIVPKNYLFQKIERVMDYEWLYLKKEAERTAVWIKNHRSKALFAPVWCARRESNPHALASTGT